MDIAFDFKGDPLGGVIHNCKFAIFSSQFCIIITNFVHFRSPRKGWH